MLNSDIDKARNTAESLGYMLEEDFVALCGIEETTAEAWRKRGKGPVYVLAGKRYLYPKKAVSEWLADRTKKFAQQPASFL